MKLFYRELGQGQPMIILHGIFGSSDNWLTQAKLFSAHYRVFLVDQRNHGQSPHDDAFDYPVMVADLLEFIDEHRLENPIIIGHSMGGKVAMNFAVAYPDKLEKLIVVDIAPRPYNLEHYVIIDGLKAVPIQQLASRNDADAALVPYVPEPDVRQFLLKNLQRKAEGGFSWKINLPVIDKNLSNIGLDLQFEGTFEKPTLFIRGGQSKYVRDKDMARILEVFPMAIMETLDTGHWVQAEKPKEFVEVVEKWLNK
ncbi:alpha/beta fold hydrolase [Fulvivirgaceae bacterium PWU4]|uniref:Alpha/beta fold hydrolase n=1 Tax=Chryseosolibacter histidini TaxID=2782349 RepID=A0AAP2DTL3_9BACT|nr:alpha/beta fold hydrolase [Chryseosolibacter histidini]MBT1701284.1 alpha/beta fold hydrolase [Chryseosolibacter histidini]